MLDLEHTVKSIRALRRLSQVDVADRVGVSITTYRRLERGHPGLAIGIIERTAAVLGVSATDLVSAMARSRPARRKGRAS